MYFMHEGILIPFPAFASFIKFSYPHPHFHVQKITSARDPNGKMRYDTRKSQKYSHVEPDANG